MSHSISTRSCAWQTTATLLRHEARTLWQNRMGCLVLALAFMTAAFLRIDRLSRPAAPEETCYVLYWQEDDFVRHLEAEARRVRAQQGLQVEVAPADRFTGEDGLIRYPPGSHSIQLRSREGLSGGPPNRVIEYWYSGSDPAAIWPYAEWFQTAALSHFDRQVKWEVQSKPLRPELVVLGKQTRVTLESFRDPRQSGPALVWVVLFFAACHLPKLSLAESTASGTVFSLVTTPAGWNGVAWSLRLFYGTLAILLAVVMTAILNPAALATATFWLTALCGTVLYLGVAFVIACWCRSVASASAGTMAYLFLSGAACLALVAISRFLETAPRLNVIAEIALAQALKDAWSGPEGATDFSLLTGPILWAAFWHVAGEFSFRRLRDR